MTPTGSESVHLRTGPDAEFAGPGENEMPGLLAQEFRVGQKVHLEFFIGVSNFVPNVYVSVLEFPDGSCRFVMGSRGALCGRKPSPDPGDCPQ